MDDVVAADPAGLTFLLIANPLSAATSAPELLPQPWGALGQALPPRGAMVSLLRSVAYFDRAAATMPLTVLGSWTAAVLVLWRSAPTEAAG
ncbi:hypothetical protein [Spirillospora sp. CA-294931]|uniref:hypothetical protein n=1 Tax=Spirillospora sp. CA-294931 TaxID=3240042 RepID=UPI003D925BC4